MDAFDIIALLGIVQSIVIAVLILSNKVFGNRSNRQVAYFLLLLAFIGLDARLSPFYSRLAEGWGILLDIVGDDIPWVMIVYLPLFRFFQETTGSKQMVGYWVLYLPFYLFLVINGLIDLDLIFGIISCPFLVDNRIVFYQLEDYVSGSLFIFLHLFIVLKPLNENPNRWLKRLWWYTSALLFSWMILTLDQTFFNDIFFRNLEITLWTLVTFFVYWLMYSGLFQFNLASNRHSIRKISLGQQRRTDKTGLSSNTKNYYERMLELMREEKAYRNPDLSRGNVADMLGISESYLTKLLKEYAGKSFSSFVNEFRVEEVKQMLIDPAFDQYDQFSIGLEAGFKSKSSYYSTFRNFTGMTPSEFKRKS